MEIGRLCVKIAGRDSGRVCVVADTLEGNQVLIDGNVRRRKCNVLHLEPLAETIKIKKGASHADISAEFKKLDIPVWNTKAKPAKPKPTKVRKAPNTKNPEAITNKVRAAPKKAKK